MRFFGHKVPLTENLWSWNACILIASNIFGGKV